jgi:hypothetical protein
VVDVSSSDTEDLLNSLFFSPACDSPSSCRCASSNAYLFESWPKVDDMASSVCVALSADASSSHKPVIDTPRDNWRSCFNNLPVRKMRKTQRGKVASSDAPRKRSKKMKVDIDRALAAPTTLEGPISAAGFARSEWEIMYALLWLKVSLTPPHA